MIDSPHQIQTQIAVPNTMLQKCVNYASIRYGVNPIVIKAIIDVEGGKIGTLSRNSNGSYDMGVMQINTIHLKAIKNKYPGVGPRELTYKPCINIAIGTWLLKQRIDEAPSYWVGVASYHSKTPKYRNIYLRKLYVSIKKLLAVRERRMV